MTVARTSIETYHNEIKGKTNNQNEIVLKAMRRLGTASTDLEIAEVTKLFTEDHKPLDRNVVTRVLNNLREIEKKVEFLDVKNKKGRVVHHHFIKEAGKQINLF